VALVGKSNEEKADDAGEQIRTFSHDAWSYDLPYAAVPVSGLAR